MGRTLKFAENVGFETIECANCNVLFAVTAKYRQRRRDDHNSLLESA